MFPPYMTNEEVRWDFITLDRAMKAQANKEVGPWVNSLESTIPSKLRDFVRTNPPTFLISKVGEDPNILGGGL